MSHDPKRNQRHSGCCVFIGLISLLFITQGCAGVWQRLFNTEEEAIGKQRAKVEKMKEDNAPAADIKVEEAKLERLEHQHEETREKVSNEQARNQLIVVSILNGLAGTLGLIMGKVGA